MWKNMFSFNLLAIFLWMRNIKCQDTYPNILFSNVVNIVILNATNHYTILASSISRAISIDYHKTKDYVYWSDVTDKRIYRLKYPSSASETKEPIISNPSHVNSCDGIAIDSKNDHIYWTDTGLDMVHRANLDGSNVTVILNTSLEEPRAIELDTIHRWMYLSDWGSIPKIEKCHFDGSSRHTIVNTGLVWPNGLALDMLDRRLYWVDAWLDQIKSSNFDGTNITTILENSDRLDHPFDIDVFNGFLYYTDWTLGLLRVSKLPNSVPESIGRVSTMGLKIYQKDDNPYLWLNPVVCPKLMQGNIIIPLLNESNLEPVFECKFDELGPGYFYDISWFVNEIRVKSDINTMHGSNDTILRPRHWEADFDMNMLVRCTVQVRNGSWSLPSPTIYSPDFVAGVVSDKYHYEVEEGRAIEVKIRATVPLGCNLQKLIPNCKETIKVSYPRADTCGSTSNSGSVIIREQCGADIRANDWQVEHTIKVYGNIDNMYNQNSIRYIALRLTKADSLTDVSGAWANIKIPDIDIFIKDGDQQLSGSGCISQTDPNYRTFDGVRYSVQISGEHVLYKHKKEPYRVHSLTSGCYWGSCNVGIAIRSHDSLFVVRTVDEVYNPIRFDNKDNDFTATFTSRTYPMIDMKDCDNKNLKILRKGKEFTVTLPSGTEIFFRIKFDQSSHHDLLVINNINIKPSVMDIDQTEGLCGFLNFDSNDDFTDVNGNVADMNQFINSWAISVPSRESLFSESPQLANDQFYKKPFCVCGEEAPGHDPIGEHYNTVHCNLTQPLEQCYKNEVSSGGYLYTTCSRLYKRDTDVSDEISDSSPLIYVEGFQEGYIPHDLEWRSGWTEHIARETCSKAFNNITALDICEEYAHLEVDEFVEPCVIDIKATGGTRLLEGTITTMVSSCIAEVSRNETLMTSSSSKSSNETSSTDAPAVVVTTLLDEIKSQLCMDNCSGNGICDKTGECKCYPGFIGEQCSIAENVPPKKISIPGDGLCGTRSRSCARTFLNGVYESENIWCKLKHFQLINNEKQMTSPPVVVKGDYHGFSSVSCSLTTSNRRKKRSVTLPPVEGYQISLSYDGTNFGDDVSIMIYDESCYSCNATSEACLMLNSCPLLITTAPNEYTTSQYTTIDQYEISHVTDYKISKTDHLTYPLKISMTTEDTTTVKASELSGVNTKKIPTSEYFTTSKHTETVSTSKHSTTTDNLEWNILSETSTPTKHIKTTAIVDPATTEHMETVPTSEFSTRTENIQTVPSSNPSTMTVHIQTVSATDYSSTTENIPTVPASDPPTTTENVETVLKNDPTTTTVNIQTVSASDYSSTTENIPIVPASDHSTTNENIETVPSSNPSTMTVHIQTVSATDYSSTTENIPTVPASDSPTTTENVETVLKNDLTTTTVNIQTVSASDYSSMTENIPIVPASDHSTTNENIKTVPKSDPTTTTENVKTVPESDHWTTTINIQTVSASEYSSTAENIPTIPTSDHSTTNGNIKRVPASAPPTSTENVETVPESDPMTTTVKIQTVSASDYSSTTEYITMVPASDHLKTIENFETVPGSIHLSTTKHIETVPADVPRTTTENTETVSASDPLITTANIPTVPPRDYSTAIKIIETVPMDDLSATDKNIETDNKHEHSTTLRNIFSFSRDAKTENIKISEQTNTITEHPTTSTVDETLGYLTSTANTESNGLPTISKTIADGRFIIFVPGCIAGLLVLIFVIVLVVHCRSKLNNNVFTHE